MELSELLAPDILFAFVAVNGFKCIETVQFEESVYIQKQSLVCSSL